MCRHSRSYGEGLFWCKASDLEDRPMRRAFALLSLVLALVLVPTAASAAPKALASQPPVYADYLVCFNNNVFTDFTDPDGDDTRLNVAMAVNRGGGWASWWMHNTGPSTHGVFFYMDLAEIGVDSKTVSQYAFIGVDETGTSSTGWTFADSACQVQH